jgi:NAD(P)-dependent dehydrogenase (short-subunit alcohol dehydrogenase family)
MDLELAGKCAVVTGGSRGIGKAIARTLADEGVDVAIVARHIEALREAAEEIAGVTGRTIVPIVADTTSTDSVQGLAERAVSALGHVDILVNNAAQPGGGGGNPPLEGIQDDAFHSEMNTKVLGYLRCARAFAPHMKERRWGRIINVSGLAARQSGNVVGSMRNVAVAAMTKNLADELGAFGINVTVVHPGLTWTERMPALLEAQANARGGTIEEARSRMADGNAVHRIIDASDIAAIVAFLASPRSIAITGDAIAAGGGVGRAIHY